MCNVMIFLVSAWMIGTFFVSLPSGFFFLVSLGLTKRPDPAVQHITHLLSMAPSTSAERCQLRLSHRASGDFWNRYRLGFSGLVPAAAARLQAPIELVQEDQSLCHSLARYLLRRLCLSALLLRAPRAHCCLYCNPDGEGHHYS